MKKILAVILATFAMAFAWEIASRLTSDAISMALGILFGVLAGTPALLLVLASSGRQRHDDRPTVTNNYIAVQLPQAKAPASFDSRARALAAEMSQRGRPVIHAGPGVESVPAIETILHWEDTNDPRLHQLQWPRGGAYRLTDYSSQNDEEVRGGW